LIGLKKGGGGGKRFLLKQCERDTIAAPPSRAGREEEREGQRKSYIILVRSIHHKVDTAGKEGERKKKFAVKPPLGGRKERGGERQLDPVKQQKEWGNRKYNKEKEPVFRFMKERGR